MSWCSPGSPSRYRYVSRMFEVTVRSRRRPAVPDRNDRVVPSLLTTAVTPMPASLIAPARPESVAFEGSTLTVCAVPLPTWMEMEPESTSFAFGIALSAPTEGVALVPACARVAQKRGAGGGDLGRHRQGAARSSGLRQQRQARLAIARDHAGIDPDARGSQA